MKRLLFAAIAALVFSTSASAQTSNCFVPFEWCQTGCPTIAGYSIQTFATMPDALAFVASLDNVQQQTVRVTTFQAFSRHVAVLYRVLVGDTQQVSAPVGMCPTYTALVTGYAAIETAEAELNRLPLDQRFTASVIAVPPVPLNDSNTRALLIVLRGPLGGVTDDGSAR